MLPVGLHPGAARSAGTMDTARHCPEARSGLGEAAAPEVPAAVPGRTIDLQVVDKQTGKALPMSTAWASTKHMVELSAADAPKDLVFALVQTKPAKVQP
jgi:hypothetical protein